MMNIIRKFLQKKRLKEMIKDGLQIGSGCRILTNVKFNEPYLITIGNNVSIGSGVQIIPHDGAVWVIRNIKMNPRIDRFGRIEIGSNIFIGNNSIVLPNTKIGDNVIVGANSIVNGNLKSNSVYAGSPLRYICSIDEYYTKHKDAFVETKGMNPKEKKMVILKSLIRFNS